MYSRVLLLACACSFAACWTEHASTKGELTPRADAAISDDAQAGAAAAGTDATQAVTSGGAGGPNGVPGGSRGTLESGADGTVDAARADAQVADARIADASVVIDAGSVSSTHDGFDCQGVVCTAGETCVNCDFFGDAFPLICAPDPRIDSAAYEAVVTDAGCFAVYPIYECDGPEDCRNGERCVYSDDAEYPGGACVPDTQACTMPSECVICHDDDDCPVPTTCAEDPVARWAAQRHVCS